MSENIIVNPLQELEDKHSFEDLTRCLKQMVLTRLPEYRCHQTINSLILAYDSCIANQASPTETQHEQELVVAIREFLLWFTCPDPDALLRQGQAIWVDHPRFIVPFLLDGIGRRANCESSIFSFAKIVIRATYQNETAVEKLMVPQPNEPVEISGPQLIVKMFDAAATKETLTSLAKVICNCNSDNQTAAMRNMFCTKEFADRLCSAFRHPDADAETICWVAAAVYNVLKRSREANPFCTSAVAQALVRWGFKIGGTNREAIHWFSAIIYTMLERQSFLDLVNYTLEDYFSNKETAYALARARKFASGDCMTQLNRAIHAIAKDDPLAFFRNVKAGYSNSGDVVSDFQLPILRIASLNELEKFVSNKKDFSGNDDNYCSWVRSMHRDHQSLDFYFGMLSLTEKIEQLFFIGGGDDDDGENNKDENKKSPGLGELTQEARIIFHLSARVDSLGTYAYYGFDTIPSELLHFIFFHLIPSRRVHLGLTAYFLRTVTIMIRGLSMFFSAKRRTSSANSNERLIECCSEFLTRGMIRVFLDKLEENSDDVCSIDLQHSWNNGTDDDDDDDDDDLFGFLTEAKTDVPRRSGLETVRRVAYKHDRDRAASVSMVDQLISSMIALMHEVPDNVPIAFASEEIATRLLRLAEKAQENPQSALRRIDELIRFAYFENSQRWSTPIFDAVGTVFLVVPELSRLLKLGLL